MTPPSSPPPRAPHRPPTRRTPAAARRAAVRRVLLGAVLLGSALTLVTAIPSGAQRPDPPGPVGPAATRTAGAACPQQEFTASLRCWGEHASTGERVVVTITAPQDLPEDTGPDTVKQAVEQLRDRVIVIVPNSVRTGSGGTLLLALASQRIVGRDSTVSALTERVDQRLREFSGCPLNGFCDAVSTESRSGEYLVGKGVVQDGATALFTAGPADTALPSHATGTSDGTDLSGSGDDGSSSGGDLPLILFVVALLTCLLITMGVLVRRTHPTVGPPPTTPAEAGAGTPQGTQPPRHRGGGRSRSRPQQPAPATVADPGHRAPDERDAPTTALAAPARRRTASSHPSATVRTALRPQGYVAINGLLYRASWVGHGEPPAPGQQVDVGRGSTGELTVTGFISES
ncbi:hypothetical protein ACWD25_42340 [Streptomyces sp. NPDC002920]